MKLKMTLPVFVLAALSFSANASEACKINLVNSNGQEVSSFENFEDGACQKVQYSCLERLSDAKLNGRDQNLECGETLSMDISPNRNSPSRPSQPNRPGHPSQPSYPSYPSHPSRPDTYYSCTTDLVDRHSRVLRSYSESARSYQEACRMTDSICNAELSRGHTNGRMCIRRNSSPTPPSRPVPQPPRQVTATCRVDRVDIFTGIHISEKYNQTHTSYDYNVAKDIACQKAFSLCTQEQKIHQMCVVKG